MDLGVAVNDLKAHLEQGAAFLESHIPGLVEWVAKAQADPLVQAAVSLAVSPETRVMLAGFLKSAEAEFQRVEAEGKAKAAAEAQAAAEAAAAVPVPPAEPDPSAAV